MASFAPIRGTRAQLTPTTVPPVTPIVDGQFLIETDQGNESKIYTDINDGGTLKRIVVGGGGHDMIPINDTSVTPNVTDIEAIEQMTESDAISNPRVVNAYSVQRWSNCDIIYFKSHVAQGTDTVGLWEDSSTWKNYDPATDDPYVYREDWLFHKDLHGILSDPTIKDNIEIEPVFDMANSEVVSLYAMRIDDAVYIEETGTITNPAEEGLYELTGGSYVLTSDTTPQSGKKYYIGGGAVAFKFNNVIYSTSGVDVGINLKYQRTQVVSFTTLTP